MLTIAVTPVALVMIVVNGQAILDFTHILYAFLFFSHEYGYSLCQFCLTSFLGKGPQPFL